VASARGQLRIRVLALLSIALMRVAPQKAIISHDESIRFIARPQLRVLSFVARIFIVGGGASRALSIFSAASFKQINEGFYEKVRELRGVKMTRFAVHNMTPQRIPLTSDSDDPAAQKTTETPVSLFRAGGFLICDNSMNDLAQ
jgi:hypothetical protein